MLRLIRRYLMAGVMADGVVVERHEGTPQGGPLSPLLANVLLDEVDQELERRGLVFARYADDLNVYTGSKRAADDAMVTLKRLFARLRLQVNEAKSTVARAWERKFLGYSFWIAPGRMVRFRVAPAALAEMKARVRQITSRTGGRSMTRIAEELRSYLTGWKLYFPTGRDAKHLPRNRQMAPPPAARRTAQAVETRHHHLPRTPRPRTLGQGRTGGAAHVRRWWAAALHPAFTAALPISYFDRLGVPRLAGC